MLTRHPRRKVQSLVAGDRGGGRGVCLAVHVMCVAADLDKRAKYPRCPQSNTRAE